MLVSSVAIYLGSVFSMLNFFRQILPNIVLVFCKALLVLFTLTVFSSSVLRYGLDAGSVKLEDLIGYSFAALIILSVLVGFYGDMHVRVRLNSGLPEASSRRFYKILSALPFIAIVFLSLPAVKFSWSVWEGSLEPEGLGGWFLVKSLVPISFGLIAVFLFLNRNEPKQ